MQIRDVGEVVFLTSHWYDSDGVDLEPSAITLTLTHPDNTTDVWNKAQLTQGDTTADWYRPSVPDALGLWRFVFEGVVDGFDVEQGGQFLVGPGSSTSPNGPCEPWTTWEEVEACGAPTTLDAAAQELVIDQASELLFNLSGRVYSGICETTRSLCFTCPTCLPRFCSCDPTYGLDLGRAWPIWAAWDVVLDGVTLDPSAYLVRGRRWLVRTDGFGWPSGWDTGDPANFRATWAFGRPIPAGARGAARALTVELAKLCAGEACQLPQRTTSVSREGVSYTILDSMDIIAQGRTGLVAVDLWLAADAAGRKAKPRAFAPAAAALRRI